MRIILLFFSSIIFIQCSTIKPDKNNLLNESIQKKIASNEFFFDLHPLLINKNTKEGIYVFRLKTKYSKSVRYIGYYTPFQICFWFKKKLWIFKYDKEKRNKRILNKNKEILYILFQSDWEKYKSNLIQGNIWL